MKKQTISKILYIVSALLAVGFVIAFIIDACYYNPPHTGSAPLYAHALLRAWQFIVPSIIVFVISLLCQKRWKK